MTRADGANYFCFVSSSQVKHVLSWSKLAEHFNTLLFSVSKREQLAVSADSAAHVDSFGLGLAWERPGFWVPRRFPYGFLVLAAVSSAVFLNVFAQGSQIQT